MLSCGKIRGEILWKIMREPWAKLHLSKSLLSFYSLSRANRTIALNEIEGEKTKDNDDDHDDDSVV